MTIEEWRMCNDPDPMVRDLPADRYQRELRLFAIACVRRVWHLLPSSCRKAVKAAEQFAEGRISQEKLAEAVNVADLEVQEIWPGSSSPNAIAYAASAAIDASSIWPRTAAIILAATTCAASAVGCEAAEANSLHYDETFDTARTAELAAQAILLRNLVVR